MQLANSSTIHRLLLIKNGQQLFGVVLAHSEQSIQPWVTWEVYTNPDNPTDQKLHCVSGNYYCTYTEAANNFYERKQNYELVREEVANV